MPSDSAQLIASLHREGLSLELKTVDLCFLSALYMRARDRALTCLDEESLIDVFEQICELIEPGTESLRKRSTHAIQRLREQRLISRVDAAGVVRAGEYTLTTLANGIVEFFLHDDALTRESLTLLTKTLLASLAEIKAAARSAATEDAWRSRVIAPLRVTVSDLVAGIERRQRGLDGQQEEVQRRIGELLQADWFGAIDQCQTLLDDTINTLTELNTVLLHDTNQMQSLLQDVEQMATASGSREAEEAAQRVTDQVDRVAAWGSARQRAWSEYYQYVHRYLRDVVRLDPSRAISERLRNQLADWTRTPFFLVAVCAPAIRLLRDIEARSVRPPVVSPARDREGPLDEAAPEGDADELDARVSSALAGSPDTLSDVLREVLPNVFPARRFVAVGWVAAQVADEANPTSACERSWVGVPGHIEIEDWWLRARKQG
jgi:chromosome partition protein MukF